MAQIRTHTVHHGETLATIADLYYGDANLAGLIYTHNERYIENINKVYPGQVIVIPYHAGMRIEVS